MGHGGIVSLMKLRRALVQGRSPAMILTVIINLSRVEGQGGIMKHGELSERIRSRAVRKYVQPALDSGLSHFSIKVKDLMKELEAEGFPPNHPAQFCSAVRARTFLLEHGLEIERIDGPASKTSTTVVVHYRVKERNRGVAASIAEPATDKVSSDGPVEDSAAWAKRLTGKLFGLLKEELAEYGGGEAFLKWVRSEDEGGR
jgi:hypothetical protein